MANEAILRQEYSLPVQFKCADGTGIEQGAILKLADPMTASLADGDEDYVAGICHTEKIANDGTTYVSVYIDGVFDIMASGAITAGQAVATAASTEGTNYVTIATATAVGCKTLGIALEDAAGGTEERILVRLQPGCNNTAY